MSTGLGGILRHAGTRNFGLACGPVAALPCPPHPALWHVRALAVASAQRPRLGKTGRLSWATDTPTRPSTHTNTVTRATTWPADLHTRDALVPAAPCMPRLLGLEVLPACVDRVVRVHLIDVLFLDIEAGGGTREGSLIQVQLRGVVHRV